jgi:Spy/CpxP family protein refolding chaperone
MTYRIILALFVSSFAAAAQAATPTPYAGQETRAIKALSAQEIQAYQTGQGMGLAKAAELNHYPGPRHVLDLAKELNLSPAQKQQTEAIHAAMQSRAVTLGKQIVDKEAVLDRRFAEGRIDPESLRALLAEIAALQAELRYAHLNAHLRLRAVLDSHQIRRYDALRGYGSPHAGEHKHSH